MGVHPAYCQMTIGGGDYLSGVKRLERESGRSSLSLQVLTVRSRQLHSLIHGHIRVLRHSNNGPVAGGFMQTQNLDISKHLRFTFTFSVLTLSCVVCKGRCDDCVLTVLLTLHTHTHTHNRTECWEERRCVSKFRVLTHLHF